MILMSQIQKVHFFVQKTKEVNLKFISNNFERAYTREGVYMNVYSTGDANIAPYFQS